MAKAINLEDGEVFHMGQGYSRKLVSPDIGARDITLNYSVFQDGQEFPQHFHEVSADIFIVLAGSVSVREGDKYTPIREGEFAYIPPGEVHGTVNDIPGEATLISFQCPPDPALYSGDRDPAKTGVMPRPKSDEATKVRIQSMSAGTPRESEGVKSWEAANPAWGAPQMSLQYMELEPRASLAQDETTGGEAAVFVWSGTAQFAADGNTSTLSHGGALLLDPGESYVVVNVGTDTLRLIRCLASGSA